MAKQGPIIIVDDDRDDWELMEVAFEELNIPNQMRCFENGQKALHYLKTTAEQPFIILSDINMPQMGGLELRQAIQADPELRRKSIPFVFLTTTAGEYAIEQAYEMNVQGFFVKGQTLGQIRALIGEIFVYWQQCRHPNS
ncbi:MAG: histidine kinase [Chitinophagaceae bacterium]|jgi:CheY-like chemotaxis protein|nr:histidine kinase [Chitinophagaceae bacterium]